MSQQSSTSPYYVTPNGAQYGNDGDFTVSSRSLTREDKSNAWWQVDLGATFKIGMIKLFFHPYSFSHKYYGDLTVFTRVDETDAWVVCKTFKTPSELILQTSCQHSKQSWARYVRIVNSKQSSLALVEVEVYA